MRLIDQLLAYKFCSVYPFHVAICYGNVSSVQERTPSVIVIGGGVAGIAAARALQDASFQVFELNILYS